MASTNWKQGLWRVAVVISAPLLLLGLLYIAIGAFSVIVGGASYLAENWPYIVGTIVVVGLGAIVVRWIGAGFKGESL